MRKSEQKLGHKKQSWRSRERLPIVIAWVQLVMVWFLAFTASRFPQSEQAASKLLSTVTDVTALTSFAQFFSGVFYLFLFPHMPLRKRFLICTALFFSLVVIVATKQGVVYPKS